MADIISVGGGGDINPALSNDEKGVNNTYTFTFDQSHKKCFLVVNLWLNNYQSGSVTIGSTTIENATVLYGHYQRMNSYGSGGLFVAYLKNVVAGDTLTIKPQHTMYIGDSCVIELK